MKHDTQDAILKTQYSRRHTQDAILKTRYLRRDTQDAILKTRMCIARDFLAVPLIGRADLTAHICVLKIKFPVL